jgi:hypothetical protein
MKGPNLDTWVTDRTVEIGDRVTKPSSTNISSSWTAVSELCRRFSVSRKTAYNLDLRDFLSLILG